MTTLWHPVDGIIPARYSEESNLVIIFCKFSMAEIIYMYSIMSISPYLNSSTFSMHPNPNQPHIGRHGEFHLKLFPLASHTEQLGKDDQLHLAIPN